MTGTKPTVGRDSVVSLREITADTLRPFLNMVVLFKLNDRSPAQIEATAAKLRGLDGNVPTLRQLEVGVNVVPAGRAYDIALIARFDSLADMEAYQTHPYHQDMLAYMRSVTASAVAVDYEA